MPAEQFAVYLDLAEAARRLSCTAETLRRHLRRGTIAGVKVGREWRVSLAAIVSPGAASSRSLASRCARTRLIALDALAARGFPRFSLSP